MISIMADREKAAVEVEGVADDSMQGMRLDRHGLPLVPQPSDRKDDPLVCHNYYYHSPPPLALFFITVLTIRGRTGPLASSSLYFSRYHS